MALLAGGRINEATRTEQLWIHLDIGAKRIATLDDKRHRLLHHPVKERAVIEAPADQINKIAGSERSIVAIEAELHFPFIRGQEDHCLAL